MNASITLIAPDISCDHCARTIRRELASLSGVTVQDVDVGQKRIVLQYDSDEDLAAAKRLLSEIGYPVAE